MPLITLEQLDEANQPDYLPEEKRFRFVIKDLSESESLLRLKTQILDTALKGKDLDIPIFLKPKNKPQVKRLYGFLKGVFSDNEITGTEPLGFGRLVGMEYTAKASKVVTDKMGFKKQYFDDFKFEGESPDVGQGAEIPF